MTPKLSIRFAPNLSLVEHRPDEWHAPSRVAADSVLANWKRAWWQRSAKLGHDLAFRWEVSRDADGTFPAFHPDCVGVNSPAPVAAASSQNCGTGSGHIFAIAEMSSKTVMSCENNGARLTAVDNSIGGVRRD